MRIRRAVLAPWRLAVMPALMGALLAFPRHAWAGAWTLGRGRVVLKQAAAYWQADEKFASSLDTQLVFPDRGRVEVGDRIPFDPVTDGRFRIASFETGVRVGVLGWLDLGLDVPLVRADFDTAPADTVEARFGLGDVRVSAQARLLGGASQALAVRVDWKAPTGRFDPSVYAAPLSEGQADVAATISMGTSLHPYGYANAEVGYRLRMENERNLRNPGDEAFGLVEAGVDLWSRAIFKVAVDALVGRPGVDRFGGLTQLPRRRFYSAWIALLWRPSERWMFDTSVRLPIAGEDYPTGVAVFGSVTCSFRISD